MSVRQSILIIILKRIPRNRYYNDHQLVGPDSLSFIVILKGGSHELVVLFSPVT